MSVFLSHMREDAASVGRLAQDLRACDVGCWLDRSEMLPGDNIHQSIEKAIAEGSYFVACFSRCFEQRPTTYMHQELDIAIRLLSIEAVKRRWFVPVSLDGRVLPKVPVGDASYVSDFHYVNLNEDWPAGIAAIVNIVSPKVREELRQLLKNAAVDVVQEGLRMQRARENDLGYGSISRERLRHSFFGSEASIAASNKYHRLQKEYEKRYRENYDPLLSEAKMIQWLAEHTLDRPW